MTERPSILTLTSDGENVSQDKESKSLQSESVLKFRIQPDNDEEQQYIQLKPMHKSFSEPSILSPNEQAMFPKQSQDKRSYSSPYILEGYGKKSLTDEMPTKKEYYSLFCLGPTNPIRRLAITITDAKYPFHFFCSLSH
jgi:hypothetical protein